MSLFPRRIGEGHPCKFHGHFGCLRGGRFMDRSAARRRCYGRSTALRADQATHERLNLSPSASFLYTWSLPCSGAAAVGGTHYLLASNASLASPPLTGSLQQVQNSAGAWTSNTLTLPANTPTTRYPIKFGHKVRGDAPSLSSVLAMRTPMPSRASAPSLASP